MAPPQAQNKKPMGMGAKGGGLFSIDEDEDDAGFGFLGGNNKKGPAGGF